MDAKLADTHEPAEPEREARESVVIRFAGDSGDGMQFTGARFSLATALEGYDFATFPDFPAEIRAPAGTTYGVSAFQINFGGRAVLTSGDAPDVLIAMNPAALKVSLPGLATGALVIVNSGAFTEKNLHKAGYAENPLEHGTLESHRTLAIDISKMTLNAVEGTGLSRKQALRCKNMWALGLLYWMYARGKQATVEWIKKKFAKEPELAAANVAALNAGHAFGETAELPRGIAPEMVAKAPFAPGLYRMIIGTDAMAFGLMAGAGFAGLQLFIGSYPITPSSPLLHALAKLKSYGVIAFQAEDEIAAICSAIGASYAGLLGTTSSSGPGMALKTEALGLAITAELPLVVVNWQRGGPSTGLPTKTEQSDLYQAVFGRNADAPLPVIAARSPADCFESAIEAVRIATRYMTPVILLADGYIAHASEPWRLPDVDAMPRFPVTFRQEPEGFQPFARDPETLARGWAIPGTPGLEHRIGGLEHDSRRGDISYDPANHQKMTKMRAARIDGIADGIPQQDTALGDDAGPLAVVGWGSTYGAIYRAVENARNRGLGVSHIHLRYLWPFPKNLGDLLRRFERILVPEMNNGQLLTLLRSQYLLPAEGLDEVTGQPFKVAEIEAAIRTRLEN
ncbi:MAG: 2-oxoacid:acceptor oxidoreductase subunit alpha [Proteobacteria bacterium]|nr:2-oxoacid:acceptor oxidoreductase subunit alpha [Pseudomonadota bacterium]